MGGWDKAPEYGGPPPGRWLIVASIASCVLLFGLWIGIHLW